MGKHRAPQPPTTGLKIAPALGEAKGGGQELDQLSAALAGMLTSGSDPYADMRDTEEGVQPPAEDASGTTDDDAVEITPRTIFEAMLFVGSPQNAPLSSKQVAAMMRGVRPAEVDGLVRELNQTYERRNCPYTIASESGGYRLTLREQYDKLRDKF
jgi:segregation and condensation protein B